MLNIHDSIYDKLNTFINTKKIPNLIFHGPNGSGKKTIVSNFLNKIYPDKKKKKEYVMFVDCEMGKGIKFIREELKFFAKMNLPCKDIFKSIVLTNAGRLTIDAQSALRRLIELFSTTNRFFIIINNTNSLLKPILSRFCQIHIPFPKVNGKIINLHEYNINNYIKNKTYFNNYLSKRRTYLKNRLNQFYDYSMINTDNIIYNNIALIELAEDLYNKSYYYKDILNIVTKNNEERKNDIELSTLILRKNIKNEVLILTNILFMIFRNKEQIEILELIKHG